MDIPKLKGSQVCRLLSNLAWLDDLDMVKVVAAGYDPDMLQKAYETTITYGAFDRDSFAYHHEMGPIEGVITVNSNEKVIFMLRPTTSEKPNYHQYTQQDAEAMLVIHAVISPVLLQMWIDVSWHTE